MKLADLLEDIYHHPSRPGSLSVSVNKHERKHRSSDLESITTATPFPLRSMASKTRGVPVYYAFSYFHSPIVTDILKSLKGKGAASVDARQLGYFLDDTVAYMVEGLKRARVQVDMVAYPASSSNLLVEFAERLGRGLGAKEVLSQAFMKVERVELPSDKVAALEMIKAKHVDHAFIAKQAADPEQQQKLIDRTALSVYSCLKSHEGRLELKAVDKRIAKFIKGFMSHAVDEYSFIDKHVLLIDDVMSSGSTMSELFRLTVEELGAASVAGAVIFGAVSTPKKLAEGRIDQRDTFIDEEELRRWLPTVANESIDTQGVLKIHNFSVPESGPATSAVIEDDWALLAKYGPKILVVHLQDSMANCMWDIKSYLHHKADKHPAIGNSGYHDTEEGYELALDDFKALVKSFKQS